jgi:Tol biopolymer transport system component
MPSSERFRARLVALLSIGLATLCLVPGQLGANGLTPGLAGKQPKAVGKVTQVLEDTVLLRGKILTHGNVSLHRRDVFNTKGGGSVVFTLTQRKANCTLYSGSVLIVKPKKLVITRLPVGKYWCMARAAEDDAGFEAADDTVQAKKDPVFGVQVNRRHKVVVKVQRGFVIVMGSSGPPASVIVGRKQQVVVPPRRDPRPPTPIQLTPRDRAGIKRLGAPPPTDTTPPRVRITKAPTRGTTSRRATFAFVANEKDAAFSCSLDGARFHPCSSPKIYRGLAAREHAFAVRATDLAGNTGKAAVYAWSIKGGAPTRVAFASDRSGNFEIYSIDPSGRGLTRLTTNRASDLDPAWSPDGTKLAFHSDRGGNSDIYAMDADGSHQTRLTRDQATDRNPAWSPDGTKIVFERVQPTGERDLYVMHADGSGQTRLTFSKAHDFDPAWSPDGTRIAFVSDRVGNRQIYVMNADGSGQTRLTTNEASEFNPAWSPDGEKIAFHSNRADQNYEIYVMNPDGSGQTRVTKNLTGDFNPTWSPDGRMIAFQSDRDGNSEIYVMDSDGSGQTRLTDDSGEDLVPDW